jgi:hypothetical protein
MIFKRGLIVFARVLMIPSDSAGLEFGPLRGGRCKAYQFPSAQPEIIFPHGPSIYPPYDFRLAMALRALLACGAPGTC